MNFLTTTDCLRKVKALLPYYITNTGQKEMTDRARKSLISFDCCLKVFEDGKKYETKVAGVWNAFFKEWMGKEYDYLLITANDVEHDCKMVDFMVRCAEENPKSIISCKVTRDYEKFKSEYGQHIYTSELTTHKPKDPATFLLPKGVIETIGFADEQFPGSFVERDLLYRAKLAGWTWIQPDIELEYHPPYSGTLGNDVKACELAFQRYVQKWGGDADTERFLRPYNNLSLPISYVER
jgi:hypothetical protein